MKQPNYQLTTNHNREKKEQHLSPTLYNILYLFSASYNILQLFSLTCVHLPRWLSNFVPGVWSPSWGPAPEVVTSKQSCKRTHITGWFCPAAWSSLMSSSFWSSITHKLLLLLLIQLHLTSSVIFLREARITTTLSGRLCRFLVELEDFVGLE